MPFLDLAFWREFSPRLWICQCFPVRIDHMKLLSYSQRLGAFVVSAESRTRRIRSSDSPGALVGCHEPSSQRFILTVRHFRCEPTRRREDLPSASAAGTRERVSGGFRDILRFSITVSDLEWYGWCSISATLYWSR